jgi:hypothetical protein
MICVICERDLEIPDNAVVLRNRFGVTTYQFPEDHQVHVFRTGKVRASQKKTKSPQKV